MQKTHDEENINLLNQGRMSFPGSGWVSEAESRRFRVDLRRIVRIKWDNDVKSLEGAIDMGISLVVQWLRICLPVPGTLVSPLLWEDCTYHRAAKPMHHGYWSLYALEPVLHERSHRSEKPGHQN